MTRRARELFGLYFPALLEYLTLRRTSVDDTKLEILTRVVSREYFDRLPFLRILQIASRGTRYVLALLGNNLWNTVLSRYTSAVRRSR